MPTVDRIGPYRFFFFANEGNEPPHVHVQRGRALAKFWLQPVANRSDVFLERWNEFFGTRT